VESSVLNGENLFFYKQLQFFYEINNFNSMQVICFSINVAHKEAQSEILAVRNINLKKN